MVCEIQYVGAMEGGEVHRPEWQPPVSNARIKSMMVEGSSQIIEQNTPFSLALPTNTKGTTDNFLET